MEKTSRRESASTRIAIAKIQMIAWAMVNIPTIMEALGINIYAIGGSIGAFLHGIHIERIPKDIDIIVSSGMISLIKERVKNSPFFIESPESSSSGDEVFTKHFAFRTVEGKIIDIIECNNLIYDRIKGINVAGIKNLYESKKTYNRPKDIEDLKLIEKEYLRIYPEGKKSEPAPSPSKKMDITL